MTAPGRRGASLFTPGALAFVVVFAALSLWPVALRDGAFVAMPDSAVYLDQGDRIWQTAAALPRLALATLRPDEASDPPSAPASDASSDPAAGGSARGGAAELLAAQTEGLDSLRSIPYAAFVGLFSKISPVMALWVQMCVVAVFVYALLRPVLVAAPLAGAALCGVVLFGTQLPFLAAFLMPDVLGAAVILFAILLVHGMEGYSRASRWLLILLAAFAVATHYGNIPVAAAVLVAAGGALWWRGGQARRLVGLSAAALAAVLAVNAAVGLALFDRASVTPGRFPILLGRSIEDGPARWYLEQACPAAGYTVCAYWDGDIPTTISEALWEERGIAKAPAEIQARVRDEEVAILWRSFLAYPGAQIGALTGNAGRQFLTAGLDFVQDTQIVPTQSGRRALLTGDVPPFADARSALERVHSALALAGGLALAVLFVLRPRRAGVRAAIVVLAVGLIANAFVFGGLSAPVGRYQARVIWLVPLLAGVLLLGHRARAAAERAAP